MTRHYNPTIAQNAARILNSKMGDFISDEVSGIVAVLPIESTTNILFHSQATTSGASVTLLTASSDKDTYLTGVQLTISKDATCDATDSFVDVRAVFEGVSKRLALIPVMTLTAQNISVVQTFANPIKIDRGTSVTVNQPTFTAGKFMRAACVYGFTEETAKN